MLKQHPDWSDSILIEVGKRFGIGAQLAVQKALKLNWTPEPENNEDEPETEEPGRGRRPAGRLRSPDRQSEEESKA